MRLRVLGMLVLWVASAALGAETKPWYAKKLLPKDKHVADFTLKPRESRDVQITTGRKLRVSFVTDATWEQSEKYKSGENQNPIVMKRVDSESFVSSLLGAGATHTPVNGLIHLTITNGAKTDAFRIVVVSREEP